MVNENNNDEREVDNQTSCLVSDQSSSDSDGAAKPSSGRKLSAFSLNFLHLCKSPNFV